MDMMSIIKARRSVRTYEEKPISLEHWDSIKKKINTLTENHGVQLTLLKNKFGNKQFGTYGVIKNPYGYIIAVCKNNKESLIQTGMAVEKAILHCTELGIGTCWLGGTFKRDEFGSFVNVNADEIIPVVISVGYPKEKERLLGRLMRKGAKSDMRKPSNELFFNKDFDKPLEPVNFMEKTALEGVRLAPSASNKQPWRIVKDEDKFHFYLAHTPRYAAAYSFDMQVIDIGIAMTHFEALMETESEWAVINPKIENIPDGTEYMISYIAKTAK